MLLIIMAESRTLVCRLVYEVKDIFGHTGIKMTTGYAHVEC